MARIGWVPCGVCGNPEASLSENPTGTLSVQCHRCQFSGFAKAGTKAARTLRGQMKPEDEPAPAPAKPKTTPASTAPATRAAATPPAAPAPSAPPPPKAAPAAVGLLDSL